MEDERGTCPESEVLAAYIDGVLAPEKKVAVEGHLPHCPDCREVVGETVEAKREGVGVAPLSWWKKYPVPTMMAIILIIAFLILLLASHCPWAHKGRDSVAAFIFHT